MTKAVISVTGLDATGIIAKVATKLSELNINILDITQTILGGYFTMMLSLIHISFPLMYRTARGAFESFDMNLAYAGQTLGLSNTFIFWKIRMPACRQGILAGIVLAFSRAGMDNVVATLGTACTKEQDVYKRQVQTPVLSERVSRREGWPRDNV